MPEGRSAYGYSFMSARPSSSERPPREAQEAAPVNTYFARTLEEIERATARLQDEAVGRQIQIDMIQAAEAEKRL